MKTMRPNLKSHPELKESLWILAMNAVETIDWPKEPNPEIRRALDIVREAADEACKAQDAKNEREPV